MPYFNDESVNNKKEYYGEIEDEPPKKKTKKSLVNEFLIQEADVDNNDDVDEENAVDWEGDHGIFFDNEIEETGPTAKDIEGRNRRVYEIWK